jgi:hypothetical protein
MYTNDYKQIRLNAQRAAQKKKKSKVRIMSTVYPDTEDFNQAAEHRHQELNKLLGHGL